MELVADNYGEGRLDLGQIDGFNSLHRKLSVEFPNHYDAQIQETTRVKQFVESLYQSVELGPSCLRYLDLLYSRNISEHALKAFTYHVDIIETVTGGPPGNNGGNLRTHIYPRINDFKLFNDGVLENQSMNSKISSLQVHHVGYFRSPNSWQAADKRYHLSYTPRLKMERGVVFEARGFKQLFAPGVIDDVQLKFDLANYFILGRNIFFSVLSGKFDLVSKVLVKFDADEDQSISWSEWENPDYTYAWD